MESQSTFSNPFDSSVVVGGENLESSSLENISRESEKNQSEDSSIPNFPSFYPLFYHNIGFEIPPKRMFVVKLNFFTAISISLSLAFSFIGALFSFLFNFCQGLTCFHPGKEIFLSIINCIVYTSLLFYNQYYPFYISMRDETSNNSLIIVQLFTIFIILVNFIGIPGTGSIGVIYLYASFESGTIVNQFFAFVLSFWHFANFLLEIVLFFLMRPLFKTSRQTSQRVHLNA